MIYVWTEKKEKEREKERYMEKRRKMSECKKKNLIEGEKKKFVGRKNEETSIYNQCIYFVVLDFKRIFRKGRERNFFRSFFLFYMRRRGAETFVERPCVRGSVEFSYPLFRRAVRIS